MAKQPKKKNFLQKVNDKALGWKKQYEERLLTPLKLRSKAFSSGLKTYFKKNSTVIMILAVIIIAAYGFDLFNLNLTIDEEIHSFYNPPETWVRQGRWGIYLFRELLIPFTTVPFMPLFVGLCFHLTGMLILLEVWGVKKAWQKVLIGAIGIICPIAATMYTFSIMNFAIGAGYFFVALSVWNFARASKGWRYLSVLPGALAISMYQAFLPTLLVAYLAYLVIKVTEKNTHIVKHILETILVVLGSALVYWGVQKLFELSDTALISAYITNQISLPGSWQEIKTLGVVFLRQMFCFYTGHEDLYIDKLYVLGVLIFVSAMAYLVTVFDSKVKASAKIWSLLLYFALVITPFISGFFMRGVYFPRLMLSYPIALAALLMLGLQSQHKLLRSLIGIAAVLTLFVFAMTDNRLFASSHMALQRDRLVAANLNLRIADAAAEAGISVDQLKYLEVIGSLTYPEAELFPEIDTFGASFFSWDGGNNYRMILFLRTLGIGEYDVLPNQQRLEAIPIVRAMPVWPDPKSVKVVGEAVLVKFGPYSDFQVNNVCNGLFEAGSSDFEACQVQFYGH